MLVIVRAVNPLLHLTMKDYYNMTATELRETVEHFNKVTNAKVQRPGRH